MQPQISDWKQLRRKEQIPPEGDWRYWVLDAERGWGKTRTAAEYIREEVESGRAKHIALIGRSIGDVRAKMIEGPAGLLSIASPELRPIYHEVSCRLVWPNGATARGYEACRVDIMRGSEWDRAWLEDLDGQNSVDVFGHVEVSLRRPGARAVVTTLDGETVCNFFYGSGVHVTRGLVDENADNLHPAVVDHIREQRPSRSLFDAAA